MLNVYLDVVSGLVVNEDVIRRNLDAELPCMATENILMAATKSGGDRQELHERIRMHSQEAAKRMKELGGPNDLLDRLKRDKAFAKVDFADVLRPEQYVGMSPRQTRAYLADVVRPVLARHADKLGAKTEFRV